MSLNQFLAVGRSFVGLHEEKSPFEMKKECLLPIFEGSPRFAARREPSHEVVEHTPAESVQLDWIEQKRNATAKVLPQTRPAPAPIRPGENPPSAPKRNWLSILSFGLLGRKKGNSTLVQAELSLERVRVLRNDLRDADLELVVKKRPQARKASAAARSWSTVEEQQPWSKLASRLFEIERR